MDNNPLVVDESVYGAPQWPTCYGGCGLGGLALYSVTLRGWCWSHGGFERKSPLQVLELYPYTLHPRPERKRAPPSWPMHAIDKFQLHGGSSLDVVNVLV